MVSLGCVSKTLYFSCCIFVLLFGILVAVIWPFIFKMIVLNNLTLKNNTESFKAWQNITMPLYLDFYMFNWTNPEEVMANKNVKPILVEVGPYVFRELREKVNLVWNENNTLRYRQKRTWHFVPEASNGTLSDKITNVNVVAVTLLTLADKIKMEFATTIKQVINVFLKTTEKKLYVTKTVRELLFEGYEDNVLDILKTIEKFIKLPIESRFGWFYPRNTSVTYDGIMSVYTGVGEFNKLGLFDQWNFMTKTPYFSGECSKISGSSGDLWPTNTANQNMISIYATDICSALKLNTSNELVSINGLTGTRFVGDKYVFDNGSLYDDTKCYCSKNKCSEPFGVRDLSSCKHGSPAYLSFPHFYLADPVYTNAVNGLRPNKTKHEFIMAIEQNTGIPLQVDARLQINILLKSLKGLDITANLPHLLMPALWFHQRMTISKEMADKLLIVSDIPKYGFSFAFAICIFSVVSILLGVLFVKYGCCCDSTPRPSTPLLDEAPVPQPNSYDGPESNDSS